MAPLVSRTPRIGDPLIAERKLFEEVEQLIPQGDAMSFHVNAVAVIRAVVQVIRQIQPSCTFKERDPIVVARQVESTVTLAF